MNAKKWLCCAMALLLSVICMSACSAKKATSASAETAAESLVENTEAQVDNPADVSGETAIGEPAVPLAEGGIEEKLASAKQRIAELEALVEKYKPYYESQIVATYGDGGIIWKDAALEQYNAAVKMYSQYGISTDSYTEDIKANLLKSMVQEAVLDAKAQELGLSELSDETVEGLKTQAQTVFDSYVQQYKSNFATDSSGTEKTDEEAVATTTEFLNQNGLTVEALLTRLTADRVRENLHASVTADVTVSDEEIKAKYDAMVAADQEKYVNDRSYNSARNSNTVIAWNPEGYRAVKHVLVKFSDDQAARYRELHNTLDSLNAEMEALDKPKATEAPAEAAKADDGKNASETASAEDAATQRAENSQAPEAEEATAETRTREQIQVDLDRANAGLEALYEELMPKAQEVVDAFNGGADFDSLIEKYGEDPGMAAEPAKTQGYAVSANATTWEKAFTDGAMAISEVGKISEPVRGSNGLHIIWYMGNVAPGAVPFEDISEEVSKLALADKVADTYDQQVAAWIEEAAPVYYTDRL